VRYGISTERELMLFSGEAEGARAARRVEKHLIDVARSLLEPEMKGSR
jgi:hypothetical protein